MIYVVTYMEIQPASIADAATLLFRYRHDTTALHGNVLAEVLQESNRPNRFVGFECWENETSLHTRESSEDTAMFRSQLQAIHNSPQDPRTHTAFDVGNETTRIPDAAIHTVTHVDVPPPRREATEAILKILAEHSRQDEGCLRFDIFQQLAPRTNHFTVAGVWETETAFSAHELKLQTRKFREELGPMLGAPYDERIYLRVLR